eukprot:SAG31_NODE_18677_length_627_cov_0.560606_1_plen_70_part_10
MQLRVEAIDSSGRFENHSQKMELQAHKRILQDVPARAPLRKNPAAPAGLDVSASVATLPWEGWGTTLTVT